MSISSQMSIQVLLDDLHQLFWLLGSSFIDQQSQLGGISMRSEAKNWYTNRTDWNGIELYLCSLVSPPLFSRSSHVAQDKVVLHWLFLSKLGYRAAWYPCEHSLEEFEEPLKGIEVKRVNLVNLLDLLNLLFNGRFDHSYRIDHPDPVAWLESRVFKALVVIRDSR